MEQPFSTSKVTVEYFDPHGVYKLLAPGLIPRLPLRNLHWQSHAGPLRSIDTLHIDLIPEGSVDPRPILSPDPFFPTPKRSGSLSNTRDNADGFQTQIGSNAGALSTDSINQTAGHGHRNSTPVRRHQIPGLRTTPYLKVLLVRCDDNDSYKSSVRQEIRDWFKVHTPGSAGTKKTNTAENHDAFEWLVLHVVVPNTVAASQPRATGKSESGASEKPSATSRWRPGSSTLLEKLRSDFNSSSKGGVDRVAQVRIGINDVPYDILPRVVPAVPSGYKETEEEIESSWTELVSRIRSLILASFDMRVSQYEEDIKEKDGQRSLPGWNFCTFFILKEGLARGFESVGLVEDALVGYDELSVGLDMVIKEQASGGSGATANAMLGFTEDLREAAIRAHAAIYGAVDDGEVVDMQAPELRTGESDDLFDELPISSAKKPYRELILENNVSVFDFRCYIFARQVSLLQRLGNAWSTREELLATLREQQESIIHGVAPRAPPPKGKENEHENLAMLAEICKRTIEFIPTVSHVMRGDLQAALINKKTESGDSESAPGPLEPAMVEVVDNLVASFAFSIAQQVLAQTSTKSLPIPPSTLASLDAHEPKAAIPEPKTMMHPARSSSLRVSTGGVGAGRPPPSPNFFPGPGQNAILSEHEASKNNAFLKMGLEELAVRRAELYSLSRNILEECGKKRGWTGGWDGAPIVGESHMIDLIEIDLDADSSAVPENESADPEPIVSVSGIRSKLLRAALDNSEDFYRLYETLTDKALRHYTVANHIHSMQASMADLAVLKYHQGDYGSSAAYFWRTTPFFGESGWSLLELSMLVMYSRSLQQLQRKDDYAKVVLKLLSKASASERDRQQQRPSFRIGSTYDVGYPHHDAIKGFLDDLLLETKSLPNEVRVPLSSFFSVVEVDSTLEYHDGRDSFSARIKLVSLLVDDLKIEKARVRLVSQNAGAQRVIWLELPSPATITPGRNKLKLDCNVVIPGVYNVDKVDLVASNLCLYFERDATQTTNKAAELLKDPRITIYHRSETLDVRLASSSHTQLDKNNTVDIELDSGWNEVTTAEVKVKAATAGLRLLSAEATCIDPSPDFSKPPEAGLFCFGSIPSRSVVKFRFPYTVENEVPEISIRIEVSYTTKHGSFSLAKTPSVPISLALGVNVQDMFKHKALFSRFTVSTAGQGPLRLFKSELVGSELFESKFGVPPSNPVVIFPRQPATLLYKISRKTGINITAKTNKTMHLKLYYSVVRDDIATLVEKSIVDALQDTPLRTYGRLLVETVLPHVQEHLGASELEQATVLSAFSTEALSEIDWAKHFSGLGQDADGTSLASTLAGFLQSWQSQNRMLTLATTRPDDPRLILIPVDIPSVAVVHTANIQLHPPPNLDTVAEASLFPALTTNQLVSATLHLKWTRIWDTSTPAQEMVDMEFSYETLAPGDSWLVGGRRKGHFVIPAPESLSGELSSAPETEADIPLLLIPQREGWLSYPSVDIREVRTVAGSDALSAGSGGVTPIEGPAPGHYETDYKNLCETVRVVADREYVTLSLDASGPGGGPLVLGVEKRGSSGRVVM